MKKTDFTPIKLGELTDDKNKFEKSVEDKKRHLNELFEYMSTFISIDNKRAFESDIYGTFLNAFLDKHASAFPPGVNVKKLMELMSIDTAKLDFLIDKVETNRIEFNFELNEPIEIPDFNIYTKSEEQNKQYKALQSIIDSVIKASEVYEFINGGLLTELTRGGIFWNNELQKFEINHTMVLRTNSIFY
jgi:hypothetical protein